MLVRNKRAPVVCVRGFACLVFLTWRTDGHVDGLVGVYNLHRHAPGRNCQDSGVPEVLLLIAQSDKFVYGERRWALGQEVRGLATTRGEDCHGSSAFVGSQKRESFTGKIWQLRFVTVMKKMP